MSSVLSRLQRLYEWTPAFRTVFKKPVPRDCKTFDVPQTTGRSGWIALTYDNNIPVCVWITPQECYKLPFSCDERICNDTLLRVERLSNNEFIVADIWLYNSNCIFSCSTFEQRYLWLKEWLAEFVYHIPGVTIRLLHKSEATNVRFRGYESYTNDAGSNGYYRDDDGTQIISFKKLALPDCYEAEDGGYLRVPSLKLSEELRLLGDSFKLRCIKEEDGSWSKV